MASLRKASSYSKKKVRPYTRKSAKRNKSYIKAIPQNKIVKYTMGDKKGNISGKHKFEVSLISTEKIQIRDNALESCRQLVNKTLDKSIPENFYFVVKVYPHHIIRENKIAAGAGADRLSSGMRHSFGVTSGRSAIVSPGKEIFYVSCTDEKAARVVKVTLAKVKAKVPCKSKIIFKKLR
jgi:large subunit ribosomal protein L10e